MPLTLAERQNKKWKISATNVFIENRKKVQPREFREESIAVVYFQIVRLVIAGKTKQNCLQNPVYRR